MIVIMAIEGSLYRLPSASLLPRFGTKPRRSVPRGADTRGPTEEHCLFAHATEPFFPNRRDLLAVTGQLPDDPAMFMVMVHHGKSRGGGRAAIDCRRKRPARAMSQVLERDFDHENSRVLGDFNDRPDDCSLNVL
jgi:hypothetical protein